jgi:hypothetical protein
MPIEYLNPTATEIMRWIDYGLCSWCGGHCSSGKCRLRFCDSCSEHWIAGTELDYREFDGPDGLATVAPRKEDCPPCVTWWANLHLDNPAPSFCPSDWMRTEAEERYSLARLREERKAA